MIQIPVPPPPAPLPEIIIGGGPNIAVMIAAAIASCVMVGMVFVGPVGRALADGIRHLLGARRLASPEEIEGMREHVVSLERRVAELEERQDFAERLLAQARERGLLAGPPKE